MSRCFAYTPVVVRNGAALIDSIKLQKEADKAKAKAERKDEKRAKKEQKQKEKEKRKEEEKRKMAMNPIVSSKEVPTKRMEPTTEPRERSDLTEEHGQPLSSQPSYSSDSTQNSNKRKREDTVIPDGSSGQGKPIKIRLLKKPKVADPCEEKRSPIVGRTVPLPSVSNSLNEPRRADKTLPTSTRVPVASGRENSAPQVTSSQTKSFNEPRLADRNLGNGRENSAPQGIPFRQTKPVQRPEIPKMKNNDVQVQHDLARKPMAASSARPAVSASQLKQIPSSLSNKSEVHPVPSRSRNSDFDIRQPSRQQQPISINGRPVVPQSRVEQEMPSSSFSVQSGSSGSRRIDVHGVRSGGQQSGPSSGTPVLSQSHLQNGNRTFAPVLEKRSFTEMTLPGPTRLEKGKEVSLSEVPPKVGPSRIEKGKQVLTSEVPQKDVPTRFEKKIMKKHSEYEKLIGRFVPPALLAPCGGSGEDEDWLSKRVKTVNSCSRNDGEKCESAASSLWQPCARFLVDADIYALPYTVPF